MENATLGASLNESYGSRDAIYETILSCVMIGFTPLIVLGGIIGNLVAISVLQLTPGFRRVASNVYLIALALCDLTFLTTLVFTWLEFVANVNVHRGSTLGCKSLTYVAQLSDTASVWLVVATSIDRFVALFYSRLHAKLATRRYKLCAAGLILCAAAISSSWVVATATSVQFEIAVANQTIVDHQCEVDMNSRLLFFALNSIDTVLISFVPCVLVVTLNLSIVRRLHRLAKKKQRQSTKVEMHVLRYDSNARPSDSEVQRADEIRERLGPNDVLLWLPRSEDADSDDAPDRFKIADRQITRVLLVVTTVYVVFTLPSYLVRFVGTLVTPDDVSTEFYVLKCAELIAYCFYYTHHSLNFYFYTFYSRKVRYELRELVCTCARHD